jgi:hypothetical protein
MAMTNESFFFVYKGVYNLLSAAIAETGYGG